MSSYNFNEIEDAIKQLLANGLAASADKLCSLLLSSESQMSVQDQSRMLELHADSVFANKEYRRALQLYRQASQPPSQSDLLSQRSNSTSTTTNNNISTPGQARLRLKECQCHMQLDDLTIALRELEAIPVELRDVQTNVSLGRLYKSAGLRRHAVTTVLRRRNQSENNYDSVNYYSY